MTNTLHRQGPADELERDYVIFATTAKKINREGSAPKIQEFMRICLKHGPVNIGSQAEVSMLELARTIVELCGSRSELVFRELPPDDPKVRRPDATLAREVLDWEPPPNLITRPR